MRWIKNEVSILVNSAQLELNPISQHALEYQKYDNNLKHKDGINSIQDTATALISTGAGRLNQYEMNPLVQAIRDVTDAALTKPFLIETLIEKGIGGRDFISALRDEKEHPLLFLGV